MNNFKELLTKAEQITEIHEIYEVISEIAKNAKEIDQSEFIAIMTIVLEKDKQLIYR